MSRLSPEGWRILFNMIRDGKAETYNKLRRLANSILFQQEQASFVDPPSPVEMNVKKKYDA